MRGSTWTRRTPSIVAQIVIVALWFVFLRPKILGGPASYIIVAGSSMEPSLHAGDLAVLLAETAYSRGDVVAFQVEGGMVIHRIVGGSEDQGFITQGDNTPSPDDWRPFATAVLGRMWLMIPGGGRLLSLLRTPYVLGGIAGTLGALYVLNGSSSPRARAGRTRPIRQYQGKRLSVPYFGALGRRVNQDQSMIPDRSNPAPGSSPEWRAQRIELPNRGPAFTTHGRRMHIIRSGPDL
jgi:signal peptidase I